MAEELRSLEYTPTWVIAIVCSIIVLISLLAERGLHQLGKFLKHKVQDALYEALQKLKEELMLLGFISLLLTVSQGPISNMCISVHLASIMLPCKLPSHGSSAAPEHFYSHQTINNCRRLLSESNESEYCARKGKVPLFSREALHQLHIFIFVLAIVHVIFCASTMVLGGLKIRLWKRWEDSIRNKISTTSTVNDEAREVVDQQQHRRQFYIERSEHWRKYRPISWMASFFKQFHGSVTKSDYIALRLGFIKEHYPSMPNFDFHKYILRTLEHDFKKMVGISWYLWLFVVLFLLLNLAGWHPFFWLSFLPLILQLLLGAHLEHVITHLAREVVEREPSNDGQSVTVKPSDGHFLFGRPKFILYLIHFILFQNSFEMAFFVWIWTSYGYQSCIMEKLGFIIPRLIVGFIVQVLSSYSTLPLYALVTQMGSQFKQGIFDERVRSFVGKQQSRHNSRGRLESRPSSADGVYVDEQELTVYQGTVSSSMEIFSPPQNHQMSSP